MLVAFTKDQDIIDENLMDTLHYLGIYGLIMLSTIITVSVVVPYFAAFGAVLVIVTVVMLKFYLPAATALKKLKAETAGELLFYFLLICLLHAAVGSPYCCSAGRVPLLGSQLHQQQACRLYSDITH
jgi:hypothetical protein